MLVSSAAMQDELRGAEATCHIAIIGAGFSGVAMAIQLKKAGIHDFLVFEAADEVGGTWRDNVYPGCACDVPSHLYSYSFEPNARWSRVYGEQGEIWAYLRHCVEKYGLRPHLRLGAEIRRAVKIPFGVKPDRGRASAPAQRDGPVFQSAAGAVF